MDALLKKQLEESRCLRKGMEPDLNDCAETAWLRKEPTRSRSLALAEDFENLIQNGPGIMSISKAMTVSGKGSIKTEAPASTQVKNPSNRAYAGSGFTRPLNGEDITMYNRLSMRIYLESEGFYSHFINIALHNKGEKIIPVPGRFEGHHHIALEPGRWHHVVWEIPYLSRDKVTGFTVNVSLLGALPQAADTITMYVDDMRLDTVKPEHFKGFDLAAGKIAYCHSGYRENAVKQALAQHVDLVYFELRDEKGAVVFTDKALELENGFRLLDFSSFQTPGLYTIYIGMDENKPLASRPFYIGDEAYLSAAWKTLNFFFLERCGADVPGVHGECHQDATCYHPDGRKLLVCGGWHDAADLTQDTTNTIESAYGMLALAEAAKEKNKALYHRAMEEARWGLNWVMRTRFGDGYRHTGMVIGIWTKNIHGDKDDMSQVATNRPFANFMAAMLCAKASGMFQEEDPVFASWCARCAKEDFAFGRERIAYPTGEVKEVILYAQAAAASVEMYKAFKNPEYIEAGALYAKIVMQCQKKNMKPNFNIPLIGYFFETRARERILSFFHRGYEHLPMQAFKGLLETAGDHEEAKLWHTSVSLYASYIKDTAGLIKPYHLLPAGLYETDNTDLKNLPHEGPRDSGAPTLDEYNAQVINGIQISDTHFLRRFPVAYQFRGFHGTLLSKAKAAMYAAEALRDKTLKDIAVRQLEWVLGFNPFASSSMYGEGYDYHPLYVATSNQMVGAVPVGFETFENEDDPYWPMQNSATYKEIWVHTTCRAMWLIADILK